MTSEQTTGDGLRQRVRDGFERFLSTCEGLLRERPTMEHVLLVLFLVTSAYMFWEARNFSPVAAEFPRVTAGATLLLSALILLRNYLNWAAPLMTAGVGLYFAYNGFTEFQETGGGLVFLATGVVLLLGGTFFSRQVGETAETFVAEPMQVLGEAESPDSAPGTEKHEDETESGEDSAAMYVYEIDDPRGPAVTAGLSVLYMALTFTIGMLYATPIFVALWALWARMDVVRAGALIVISFVTAFSFYSLITSDIAEGWLTGWEPLPPDEILGLTVHTADIIELAVMLA